MILTHHSNTTMKAELAADLQASRRAELPAIEVQARKLDHFLQNHSRSDLERLFAESGVRPATINALEFIAFRGEEYGSVRDRCRELCEIARSIACPVVIAIPSPIPDIETTWDAIVEHHARALRELGEIAAESSVSLALEPLGFGWCSVRTLRGACQVIERAGLNNLGLAIDACHVFTGGSLMSEIDALDPAGIMAFHLDDMEDLPKEAMTDHTRLLPGLGVVPLTDICRGLSNIGYDGYCSVEIFREEYWRMDPYQVAVLAKESAVKTLSPFFSI